MTRNERHGDYWPPNQWHPCYASIRDWLENEAPVASPLVVESLSGRPRRPRFRIMRRKA